MTTDTENAESTPVVIKTAREALNDLGWGPEDPLDIFVEVDWTDLQIFNTAMTIWPLQVDHWEFKAVHRPLWDSNRPGMLLIGAKADSDLFSGEFSIGLVPR